jgi:peptidyl-prolyl cis-trans isomerase SurA
MRRAAIFAFFAAIFLVPAGKSLRAQEVVDRIVARVENDVILLSDIRALSRYQTFLDGKSETDAQILDRLIDQWIVRTEAGVSRSPQPSEAEIDRNVSRVRNSFASLQEYEARKKQMQLSDQDVRAMVSSQLYLSNYLDSRFRPAVQVDPKAIDDFYQSAVVPRAKARGQEPPSLETARDAIQEALIQNGINQQADQWLKESRLRLHVEKLLEEAPQ